MTNRHRCAFCVKPVRRRAFVTRMLPRFAAEYCDWPTLNLFWQSPNCRTMASQFQSLLDSIRAAVEHENWHAALALTLMLPDICATIETPKKTFVGQRYARWWADNFKNSYQYGNQQTDYVTGKEVFLLRCAYLHEGSDSLDPAQLKKCSATIDKFKFATSNHHLRKTGTTVILNLQTFCLDMCSRVESWEKNTLSKDSRMQTRAEKLLKIYLFLPPTGMASISSAAFTPRLMRKCKICGKFFPQDEHESLCSECR